MKICVSLFKAALCSNLLLFSISGFSQSKWYPYVGLHISGDAELYYVGPSFQAGTDLKVKNNFFISGYVLYFSKNVSRNNSDGTFEKGCYRTATATVLVEARLGKKPVKKTFIGLGLAFQQSQDDFLSSWNEIHDHRKIFIPAIRMGRTFSVWKQHFAIELNGTGPYCYGETENGLIVNYLEVLTQLSIGLRFTL